MIAGLARWLFFLRENLGASGLTTMGWRQWVGGNANEREMGMHMTRHWFFAALAILGVNATGALAQTALDAAFYEEVVQGMAPADMRRMLEADGFSVSVDTQNNGVTIFEATTEETGAFYVSLLACQQDVCPQIDVFAFFSSQGITLSQINMLHVEHVAATTFMQQTDTGLAARNLLLDGGVTRRNVKFQIDFFLNELDVALGKLQPGAVEAVGFVRNVRKPGFVKPVDLMPSYIRQMKNPKVNAVGANAPKFLKDTE